MNVHGYRRKSDPPAVDDSRRGERRGSEPLSESSSEGGEWGTGASPLPRIHSNDWQQDAACLGMAKPDLFFPSRGGKFSKEVRQLCAGCPVWRECLRYAHASVASWTFGYWGGLTDVERKGKSLQEAIALAESRRVEKAS